MKEHILLHVCCGPCAIAPVLRLRDQGHDVTALFVNPNIHPFTEYLRRREALEECAIKLNFDVIYIDNVWDIKTWLTQVNKIQSSGIRCEYCYYSRLSVTANIVKNIDITKYQAFTAFSSSLLYSRYQRHELIISVAERCAKEYGVRFYYNDFRTDWQKGIDISKELNLYRQPYCGCIYSEAERYEKKLHKLIKTNITIY